MRLAKRMWIAPLAAVAVLSSVHGCDRSAKSKPAAGEPPPAAEAAAPATAPAKARIMPPDYEIPWVTVSETADGKALRVKIKQTLSTIELVKVSGGSVEMPVVVDGKIDPSKKQTVQIKPFWIGRTELPWDFYDAWRLQRDLCDTEQKLRASNEDAQDKTAHSWSRPSKVYNDPTYGFGHQGYAAISVHPQSAAAFCRWMSILTGKTYRLATEAEWEYACRAGAAVPTTREDLDKIAWFEDNSENMDTAQFSAQPVGKKPANAFGLHDMLGNVGEWVVGIDGQFVLKGGSFESPYEELTPGFRVPMNPNLFQIRDPQYPKSIWWLSDGKMAGFRIVREEE